MMGSSILHPAEVEEIELLSQQQNEACRAFRRQENPRGEWFWILPFDYLVHTCIKLTKVAYTSPRALNLLIQGKLPVLPDKSNCHEHHVLLLVPTQTFEDEDQGTAFVSTICMKCHFHFHIKSDTKHSLPDIVEHPNHMLIPYKTKTKDDLRPGHTKYSKPEGYVRFVCAARSCNFWLEISIFAPKLSRREVDMIQSNGRVQLHLKKARAEDPERYANVNEDYGSHTADTFLTYLSDALNTSVEDRPKRIKKRNKRFKVSFSTDFDPLLRSLGFVEGSDDDIDDSYWVICQPESQRNPTPVGTLRAQVEDAMAEISLLKSNPDTIPAWEKVMRAFGGRHQNLKAPDWPISEDDLALLGCLDYYPPLHFSWAARLLSDIHPGYRNKYLEAALRCIRERSEEAQSEIVLYQSQFDTTNSADKSLEQAYEFFGVTEPEGISTDFLLSKYHVIAQVDRTDATRALAQQHLEVIGHHLNTDIVSLIDPQSVDGMGAPGLNPASASSNKRRMSIRSATRLLNVDAVYPAEMIRDFILNLVSLRS